jgi:hypothetical protein
MVAVVDVGNVGYSLFHHCNVHLVSTTTAANNYITPPPPSDRRWWGDMMAVV